MPNRLAERLRLLLTSPLRSGLLLAADGLISGLALTTALWLRFEVGAIPESQRAAYFTGLPLLVLVRILCGGLGGLHRWSFRMSGLHEAARLAGITLLGSVLFFALAAFLQIQHPPRTVVVLEFFLTTTAMAAYRFAPRLGDQWLRDLARPSETPRVRAFILGAGSAGDLLMRDLARSDAHPWQVIGFLDDDRSKLGTSLGGRPVLGKLDDLATLVEQHRVTQVLIAIPRLPAERIRSLLGLCARLKVSFKIIPASFTYLDEKVSAAMLHDLSPEDLLPRDQISFDAREVGALISGRRVLVTGAGGSIGSEIARQVAAQGPAELVLVDMNENELYFLARRLQERFPHLVMHALVADVRDAEQMLWLGQKHRPQDVFHAAAHKHVPLMEDMPAEAVKNNVYGTLNVARMAHETGVERFVLISTDKAVRPSSVMGVSKRVAEFVVRDLARRSKTRFTAVRFGNVLGSAGSVVPLFKQQIERGGPVTVTHPDCTRYFMTIPEAVGLVLLAGLGQHGELCILDMGEAIRIADLAASMITMSGRVPNVDVPIVFTGLRPGEKLFEELFTEEEEQSRTVRNKVMVATCPPPPADLAEKLEALRQAALTNDREQIVAAFKTLVPSFKPPETQKPQLRLVVGNSEKQQTA